MIQTLCLHLIFTCTIRVAAPTIQPIDTWPDTWAATDALGRRVIDAKEAGPPRPGKFVGIFYFLWLDQSGANRPYDITQILAQDPGAMQKPDSPLWGPMQYPHYWGEPFYGYYRSDDAWVLAKHAQMLADADIDTIIFDVSNQVTYQPTYMRLCEVFTQLRSQGRRTPQIAFLTPFWDPPKVVAELYANLYKPGKYPDLWFRWKGKPLIMADPEKSPPETRDFFTFRKPQPDYFKGPTGSNQWGWLEIYPQHAFYNAEGKPPEQATVGLSQNATGLRLGTFSQKDAYGRSWHDGRKDPRPDAVLYGYQADEQWKRALEIDPEFIFITGWNEWIAGRFSEFNGVREPVMFVDEFTQEYSRDIEPMKGGHADNYYYQMVSFIRRFKGVRPPRASSGPKTIQIDGDFRDWADVHPEYRDDAGDIMHRNHPGNEKLPPYINQTGRNDFVLLKVARDDRFIYFYARTAQPITPRQGSNWMNLFIDTDSNPKTGWCGYDFVVNRSVKDDLTTVLEASDGSNGWKPRADIAYNAKGREIELAIPRSALGLTGSVSNVALQFKWADNLQSLDPMAFITDGDTAPNGRFNYVFAGSR